MIRRSYSHNNNKQDIEISQLKMILHNNIQQTQIDSSNRNKNSQINIYKKSFDVNSSFLDYLMQDINMSNKNQIIDQNEASIFIPSNQSSIDKNQQKSCLNDVYNLVSQYKSSNPSTNKSFQRGLNIDFQNRLKEGSRRTVTTQNNEYNDTEIQYNQKLDKLDEIQQFRKNNSNSVNSKCIYKIFPNIAVKLPSITPIYQNSQTQNSQNQMYQATARPHQLGYSLDQHPNFYKHQLNQQKQNNRLSTEPPIKLSQTVNTAPNGTKQYIDKSFEEIIQRISADTSNMNSVKQKYTQRNSKKILDLNDNSYNEMKYTDNIDINPNDILNSNRRMLLKYKNKSSSRNRVVNTSLNQNIPPLNMSELFKQNIQKDRIMNYINCKFNQIDSNQTNLISKEEIINYYETNPNPLYNYKNIEQYIQNNIQMFSLDLTEKQTERAGLVKFKEFKELLNEFFNKNTKYTEQSDDTRINLNYQSQNKQRDQQVYMSIQEQENKRYLSQETNNSQNRLKNIYTHRLFSAQKMKKSKNEENSFQMQKDNSFNTTYDHSSQYLRKPKQYKQNTNNQNQLNILLNENQISERKQLNKQYNQINHLNQIQIQNIHQNKILNNLQEVNITNHSKIEQQMSKFKQEEQQFFTEQKVRSQSAMRSRNQQFSARKKVNTSRYDKCPNDSVYEFNEEIQKYNPQKNESQYTDDDSNESTSNEQSSREGMIKLNQLNYNQSNQNLQTSQFVKISSDKTNQDNKENNFVVQNSIVKQNKPVNSQNNKLLNEMKINDSFDLRNMSRESESTRLSLNYKTQEKFPFEGGSQQTFFNKNSNTSENEKEEINMINQYNQLQSSQEITDSDINIDKSTSFNYKPIYCENNTSLSYRYHTSHLKQEQEEQESKLAFEDQKLTNLLKNQKSIILNRTNFKGVSGSLLLQQYNMSFKKDYQEKKNQDFYVESNPIIEQNEPTLTEPNEQSVFDQNEQKQSSQHHINEQEDIECTFRAQQIDNEFSEKKQSQLLDYSSIKGNQKDNIQQGLQNQSELHYLNPNINCNSPPNNIETPQYQQLKKIEIKETFKKVPKLKKEDMTERENFENKEKENFTQDQQILNKQTISQVESNLSQINKEIIQHLNARRSLSESINNQESYENCTEQDICDNIEIQEAQITIQTYSSKFNNKNDNQSSINTQKSNKTNQKAKQNENQDNIENSRREVVNNHLDLNCQNFLNKKEVKVMKKLNMNKITNKSILNDITNHNNTINIINSIQQDN